MSVMTNYTFPKWVANSPEISSAIRWLMDEDHNSDSSFTINYQEVDDKGAMVFRGETPRGEASEVEGFLVFAKIPFRRHAEADWNNGDGEGSVLQFDGVNQVASSESEDGAMLLTYEDVIAVAEGRKPELVEQAIKLRKIDERFDITMHFDAGQSPETLEQWVTSLRDYEEGPKFEYMISGFLTALKCAENKPSKPKI